MTALPTNRTTSNTPAEHVADHNEAHTGHNLNETHRGATTAAHGGLVAATDARLSDARTPTDGSVTAAKLADAELAALASLASAANKLPYFTGSGTAGLADLTAFARTLLDDADAAAMRTTIGAAPTGPYVGPTAVVNGASASVVIGSGKVTGDAFDRWQLLADGTVKTGDGTYDPVVNYDGVDEWALTDGQESMPRGAIASSGSGVGAAQRLSLTYFRAKRNRAVTQVAARTGATAASGVTLARLALYTVAADGALTLVASTANDTTLFAATFTKYTKALQAGYSFVAGQLYASGVLVDATTLPTFHGQYLSNEGYDAPRMVAGISSQANPAASYAAGQAKDANNTRLYVVWS